MSKIVTLFFAQDDVATEFIKKNPHYFKFVETMPYKRMDRMMDFKRYQNADKRIEEHS